MSAMISNMPETAEAGKACITQFLFRSSGVVHNFWNVLSRVFFCRGQDPAEAELHFLENARKLALYGMDFHQAKVCKISSLILHKRMERII